MHSEPSRSTSMYGRGAESRQHALAIACTWATYLRSYAAGDPRWPVAMRLSLRDATKPVQQSFASRSYAPLLAELADFFYLDQKQKFVPTLHVLALRPFVRDSDAHALGWWQGSPERGGLGLVLDEQHRPAVAYPRLRWVRLGHQSPESQFRGRGRGQTLTHAGKRQT